MFLNLRPCIDFITCCPSAIMCPSLPSLANGELIFVTDMGPPHEFGTEVTYTCDTGYDIAMGKNTRICEGDGSTPVGEWSGTAPICTGEICTPKLLM